MADEEDDALKRYNLSAAVASRLPGVGAPGSTPATDAQNLAFQGAMQRVQDAAPVRQIDPALQPGAIAAATAGGQPLQTATRPGEGALDIVPIGTPLMSVKGVQDPFTGQTQWVPLRGGTTGAAPQNFNDLVSNAIDSKRNAIETRRNQILGQLQYANPKQARSMAAELQGLEQDRSFYQQEHHQSVMEGARNAELSLQYTKDARSGQEYSGLAKRLSEITATPGSNEHQSAVYQAMQDFPYGAMSEAGRKAIGDEFGRQPPTKDAIQNALTQGREFALRPGETIEYNAKGEPIVKFGTKLPEETASRYSRIQGELNANRSALLAKMQDAVKKGKTFDPSDDANLSIQSKINAASLESSLLEKSYPELVNLKKPQAVTPVAAAPKKHLGTYNPQTGNIE